MIGYTITLIVVSEGARKTCKKYKLFQRGMRAIMKISEWIKSKIKSYTALRLTSKRHRPHHQHSHKLTHCCNRYVSPKRIVHTLHIGKKFLKSIRCIKVICTTFPDLSYTKTSYIRKIPQKFPVNSDSFVIGINNHASTTISNESSHFVGAITPVKVRMVKTIVGLVEVKY